MPNKVAAAPFISLQFLPDGARGKWVAGYTGERSAPVLIPLCCGGPAAARRAVKALSSGQKRQGTVAEVGRRAPYSLAVVL